MLRTMLIATSIVMIAVVPATAGDAVKSDEATKSVEAASAAVATAKPSTRPENYTEDMIEPILRAAMKKAIAEYHGWDDYAVSEK